MLTILGSLLDAMLQQAQTDHPIETCGVIAGSKINKLPQRFIPMKNVAQSTSFFEFDSKQHLQVWREMEERDEVPVVIFHSHTASPAYPSHTDRAYAMEPDAHYVIISTEQSQQNNIRSFRIVNGEVTEERILSVASYHQTVAC